MAEAMGISTYRYKVVIFVYAAVLAAISGWLFAHYQRTVNPTPFGLNRGIEYLFMAVLGGVGQVWGAFIGAGAVKLIEDQLQVLAARAHRHQRQLRSDRVRRADRAGAEVRARRPVAGDQSPRRTLAAAGAPRQRLGRRAAPAGARRGRAPATCCCKVQAVRKEFGGLVAVNDVSFELRAGEIVGLIGPNGAGKSTTFNLLTGALVADTRQRRVRRPHDRRTAGARDRAPGHRAHVPAREAAAGDDGAGKRGARCATSAARSGALRAMLRLDRDEERRFFAEAEAQLQRIGMGHQLHELAGNLPLGPQRLLEIARALCTDPVLLLLDEPAAGLRHQEKQALAAVLRQLKGEGVSILLVEHDMDFVMGLTDRIVVMEFGTKLTEGTPAEVQASPAVRAAYLGTEH